MRESVDARHKRVLGLVRERGSVRVVELAARLGVSVETARRDVATLAEAGRLRRLHGSVHWPTAQLSPHEARLARSAPATAAAPAAGAAQSGLVLGMVVPATGYFYPSVIRGARAAAAALGARLLVGTTDYRGEEDTRRIETLVEAGATGLLLTPSWGIEGPDQDALRELIALPVPAVLVERRIPTGSRGADIGRVGSAHAEGAASAVRHLAALGHRRIALLSRTTHTSPHLRRGYRAAISSFGFAQDDLSPLDAAGPGGFDTFERDTDRLLELAASDGVRAAIVHTDADAINLLQRLTARGLRVPEDFAIVAYDDELAALADVPLTSIAPAKHAMGDTAVRLLLRQLTEPDTRSAHIELLPRLRVRASCGASTTTAG
ncbi:substrate-binding domain-containing protein [Streptomyces sp. NBC_01381]|uniref:LacI family DNA-binding transcriptional regulator n=1 Tax=Streptomyces sp. NBC_01381 TaxID=2903845 RepID=UPI002250FADB|nr:substrate-binding domain-containing protein [Streptomyces sp. NBC_01381]MCX4671941.1 substrate-binding domain-containing protein [Streptomyces sp. NBC_01381]